jgi:hypothetical protein
MSKFTDYLRAISQVNDLGNGLNIQWLFHCGMLFSTRDKWWGDFKYRSSVHEGIDITYYRIPSGKILWFDDSVKVPAMDDGIILNICGDFLGQTIVVEHEKSEEFNRRILFVYAHIIPEKDIEMGGCIKKNQVIARVCDTIKNPQLPPHLHFSCFEVSNKLLPDHLNWTLFSTSSDINRINPVFL